jgi:Fe-S-cluster containining protein
MQKFSLSPLARPTIERIWTSVAAEIGFAIVRTDDAYASSDGAGRISIGNDAHLDDDDAVAQLIFHELCHALCEGPDRARLPDWGLDNTGAESAHVVHEHACLRLQIQLAGPFGLRELMAPTTEYRAYYDQLPTDPLADDGDPAVALARVAAERATQAPWRDALARALEQTARSLEHPLGFRAGPAGESCGTCAWQYLGGRGRAVLRCRQSADRDGVGRRIGADGPSCDRWEAPVDCHACGACCREAYHSVTVSMRDPVVWRQPDLIMREGHRFEIRRDGDRCAALIVETESGPLAKPSLSNARGAGGAGDEPRRRYACSIYADRPQACRDFEAGGRHCLDARRRVGMSRA